MTAPEGIRQTEAKEQHEPYQSKRKVIDDIHKYAQMSTPKSQKIRILNRLADSGEIGFAAVSELVRFFDRNEPDMQHRVIDLFDNFLKKGADLSDVADDLGKHLNSANGATREKIATLLKSMSSQASGAITRLLGCTRHSSREIKMLSVDILGNIGQEAVSEGALRRLNNMRKGADEEDEELAKLLDSSIQKLEESVRVKSTRDSARFKKISSRRTTNTVNAEKACAAVTTLLDSISCASSEGAKISKAISILNSLPLKVRRQALGLCFKSKSAMTRCIAARVLHKDPDAALPLAREINEAYKNESEALVKEDLGKLLKILLEKIPPQK